MPLEEPCSFVGDPAAAKRGMHREPLQVRDLGATVSDLEAHHAGALAVHLDHETAVLLGLRLRALDLAQQALAVERCTSTEERFHVRVVQELKEEVEVVRTCPSDGDHGAWPTGARRSKRRVPVPSATP